MIVGGEALLGFSEGGRGVDNAAAKREGSRMEKARRGKGAREMEVREESVAPWK